METSSITPRVIGGKSYYTTQDLCTLLDCSERHIQRLRDEEKLPFDIIREKDKHHSCFYLVSDVEDYLKILKSKGTLSITPRVIGGVNYYTTQDLCFLFDCSKRKIQRLRKEKILPFISDKRQRGICFYLQSDVENYLKSLIKDIKIIKYIKTDE